MIFEKVKFNILSILLNTLWPLSYGWRFFYFVL